MEALRSNPEPLRDYPSNSADANAFEGQDYGPQSGAELRLPPWSRLNTSEVLVPLSCYFCFFQLLGLFVRKFAWTNYCGFRQYRLRNLTVCVIHSTITGCWALAFLFLRPEVMFDHVIHWVDPVAVHLPMISIGYFAYDTTDMLRHEISKWTIELLIHHIFSIFALASAVLPQKFIPYAHWALIMEFNSIFLHIRSVMQLSGEAKKNSKGYSMSKLLNTVTFVFCRFLVQGWQLQWAWHNYHSMHAYYALIALAGGFFFLVINSVLFIRILAADGWFGEKAKQRAAIGRDSQCSDQMHKLDVKSKKE
ncbi:hypothetical protein L596_004606 [Steinernema carpocapsae]|uniref:TLC domain-containing protein n=1 Tax=Steinernema carpocapsae TaxID=34508 RepID=A0A4U8UWH4_STECR|nr:hypothetical protein L596_004606 [Steinernema carpocapsae]